MTEQERREKARETANKLFGGNPPKVAGIGGDAGWLTFNQIFGEVWSREDVIDMKLRSLATIVTLTALARHAELREHLRGALVQGWTPDELREVIAHVGYYAGMPCAVSAGSILRELTEGQDD